MASTRGERLRAARKRRYHSARAAAAALDLPASTYGAHERAEAPGGRDYGPDEARRYARHFGTTPEWLLTGRGPVPADAAIPDQTEAPSGRKVRVVGSTVGLT